MPSPEPPGEVIVVGAGIVGICTALSLLERGISVRLVDRGDPGQETSMGNAGVVSPWSIIPQSLPGTWRSIPRLMLGYGKPLSVHPRSWPRMIPWGIQFLRRGNETSVRAASDAMSHLCAPTIELYRKHLDGTGAENLIQDSMYVHAFRNADRADLNALDYRIRAEKGAEMELVGQDRLSEVEPALSADFKAAILVKGQARIRSPGRLGAVLAKKATKLGATFAKAEVTGLSPDGAAWRIECKDRTLTCDKVVVCLGVWSRALLRDVPLAVPLMAERGYHVEFSDPGIEIKNSVMDVDAKFVASSMEGGLRVAGQAEFAPVDAPRNAARQRQLTDLAKAAFQGLRTTSTRFWMGRRPSFPDSLPMLGQVPGRSGLYLNFGHSHYGLMMAPKSGDVLTRMICNEHSNYDLSSFSPVRFS